MYTIDPRKTTAPEIERFIALNSEIAGLIHVGLPLELGLKSSTDQNLRQISQRLRDGEPLLNVLSQANAALPTAYGAIVEAGIATGNLGESIQSVSRAAQAMATLKRRLSVASIYPSILLILAFAFSAFIVPYLYEPLSQLSHFGRGPSHIHLENLFWLFRENPTGWLFWLPSVTVVLLWALGGSQPWRCDCLGLGAYYATTEFRRSPT